jgi:hypothetical protein
MNEIIINLEIKVTLRYLFSPIVVVSLGVSVRRGVPVGLVPTGTRVY